jgi:hypothetical protein
VGVTSDVYHHNYLIFSVVIKEVTKLQYVLTLFHCDPIDSVVIEVYYVHFSGCCLLTYESDIHMPQVQDLKENTQELKLFL